MEEINLIQKEKLLTLKEPEHQRQQRIHVKMPIHYTNTTIQQNLNLEAMENQLKIMVGKLIHVIMDVKMEHVIKLNVMETMERVVEHVHKVSHTVIKL